MSNGCASTNCVVVTDSNVITFPLINPLLYVNTFSLENGTVAEKTSTVFLQKRQPLLEATAGVSYEQQLQRFSAEGAMKVNGTTFAIEAHLYYNHQVRLVAILVATDEDGDTFTFLLKALQ